MLASWDFYRPTYPREVKSMLRRVVSGDGEKLGHASAPLNVYPVRSTPGVHWVIPLGIALRQVCGGILDLAMLS
jgi:hypothetical protein